MTNYNREQKMTLDEAIKHAEEVAEENEKFCYKKGGEGGYFNEDTDWNNIKCATEHRQLAEWLKELKAYKEQEPCEDVEVKKIDEWEIRGKNAELWIVKGNLQVHYLGTIHNIPLPPVTQKLIECDDAISRNDMLDAVGHGTTYTSLELQKIINDLPKVNPVYCDDAVSRILKRMWNCRGKHTTSIDKVKMEQIIREELPSVNPHKSGKWINKDDFIYALRTCGFSIHHGQVMYAEDDLIQRFDELVESEE